MSYNFNTEYMINLGKLSREDVVTLVKKVYDLSIPVGLGMLHYRDGGLSDGEVNSIIKSDTEYMVRMDYVNGRQCKFNLFYNEETGDVYTHKEWYDHTDSQFKELLSSIGKSK